MKRFLGFLPYRKKGGFLFIGYPGCNFLFKSNFLMQDKVHFKGKLEFIFYQHFGNPVNL